MPSLPPTHYLPVIKRPDLHIFGQNKNSIRGSRSERCIFCSALLPSSNIEICPVCHSTQISIDCETNGKIVKDSPLWKQRFHQVKGSRRGYEGL